MSREALVLLVCCCDFRDGAERLIPSKSLRNAVIRAFPGLFCILRMCAPRRAAAVVRPRGREKSADRRRRILISRLLIIRASVPRRKSPFPAYFRGFPAVSPLIPPYPAFLKYPVSPHYGIFLFFSIFPIIHPKGLAQMPEGNMENTELLPLGVEQKNDEAEHPSFDLCLGENLVSPLVAQHRQWLKSIRHETPNPKTPFKVAVYIRFFNQTKYRDEEYLERNKEVFRATLSQYPMWEFVGFYIDNGSTAPYMENSTAWSELLSDCDAGKVDLIITQKVSNVSRDAQEMTICARILAARKPPVGIYFISEDLYTLASYYRDDLREPYFFPTSGWKILPDDELDMRGALHE